MAIPSIDFSSPDWGMVSVFFAQAVLTEYHFMGHLWWPRGLPTPSFPGELKILATDESSSELGLIEFPHGILRFHNADPKHHSESSAIIAARTRAELAEYMAKVKKILPKSKPEKKGEVPITFWAQGRHGNTGLPRDIDIPGWKDIEGNYTASTRESVTSLVKNFEPASGKLVLWHGEPGTGKTWALRALLGEWKKWCKPQYIVDPEKLFGSDSSYLLQVLMDDDDDDEVIEEGKSKPWRVLILEDTGELLSQDAKERSGQGLSRLLNVTDGLIGQGLRVVVLITTNEPLSKLHPAVARPGRTAAEIEFATFSSTEAETWLLAHGIKDAGLNGSHTLAELYARLAGRRVRQRARERVGF